MVWCLLFVVDCCLSVVGVRCCSLLCVVFVACCSLCGVRCVLSVVVCGGVLFVADCC